jgi:hypothetical protein
MHVTSLTCGQIEWLPLSPCECNKCSKLHHAHKIISETVAREKYFVSVGDRSIAWHTPSTWNKQRLPCQWIFESRCNSVVGGRKGKEDQRCEITSDPEELVSHAERFSFITRRARPNHQLLKSGSQFVNFVIRNYVMVKSGKSVYSLRGQYEGPDKKLDPQISSHSWINLVWTRPKLYNIPTGLVEL